MKIILWDIDGTLVRSNGGRVAVNAFLRALCLSCQLEHELPYPYDSAGKTDPQIALEILAAASIAESRASQALEAFAEHYLMELKRQQQALITDLRVLPGVSEILEVLTQRGIVQSLLTGNLEPVARFKLACAGIEQYLDFDLGAYGSDNADARGWCRSFASGSNGALGQTRATRTSWSSAIHPGTSPVRARAARERWRWQPATLRSASSKPTARTSCSTT